MKIPLIVCGAFGRMGREVIAMASSSEHFSVKAAVTHAKDTRDAEHQWSFPLYRNLDNALVEQAPAVVIDFSHADAAHDNFETAARYKSPLLLATTGYGALDTEFFAQTIPIVVAPNTSLMANLLIALSSLASASLKGCEISILDLHHAGKKDAPSGTALVLKTAIASSQPDVDVEIRSMRKGRVLGEHTVYFFSDHDRLELTHRVSDRRIFAEGALVAAQFLFGRRPGLYDMNDVLNLNLTIKK